MPFFFNSFYLCSWEFFENYSNKFMKKKKQKNGTGFLKFLEKAFCTGLQGSCNCTSYFNKLNVEFHPIRHDKSF